MEDELWWKTAFDGLQPSMEDVLRWKTIFDGRQPSIQDNLWREKTKLLNCWLPKLAFETKDPVLL